MHDDIFTTTIMRNEQGNVATAEISVERPFACPECGQVTEDWFAAPWQSDGKAGVVVKCGVCGWQAEKVVP